MARDHAVKGWSFTEDLGEVDTDWGSGYPGGKVQHMKHQELLTSPQRPSTLLLPGGLNHIYAAPCPFCIVYIVK